MNSQEKGRFRRSRFPAHAGHVDSTFPVNEGSKERSPYPEGTSCSLSPGPGRCLLDGPFLCWFSWLFGLILTQKPGKDVGWQWRIKIVCYPELPFIQAEWAFPF